MIPIQGARHLTSSGPPKTVFLPGTLQLPREFFPTRIAFVLLWLFVFAIPVENVLVLPGVGTVSRLVGFLTLPFCLVVILERGHLRRLSAIHGLMALYVFWACLTYFWTAEPARTLRVMGTYVQLLVMVWLFWELASSRDRQHALLKAFVWGAMVSSLATLHVDVTGPTKSYQRYVAFGFDPNDLGLVLALSVPLSLYLAEAEIRPLRRMLHRCQTVFAVAATLMTASRGATLALAVGLILIPLNFSRWNFRRQMEIVLALSLGVGAAVLLVPQTSWKRLASIKNEVREGSFNQRLLIWQTGWDDFRKRPFFGVGMSALAPTVERHLGQPYEGELVAHNSFLSVLFEGGVVGFGIYASLLLAMVLAVLRVPSLERNLWLVALLAWGVGVCSLTWEYRKPTWFLFGMLTVQANGFVAARKQLAARSVDPRKRRSIHPSERWSRISSI